MAMQILKRCSSSEVSLPELKRLCQSEVYSRDFEYLPSPKRFSREKSPGCDSQIRCKSCHDFNPYCQLETAKPLVTTLAEVQRSRDAGCKFCRLLCETHAHYYPTTDVDWPDFRFELRFQPGRPVIIQRRKINLVCFPVISLYAPENTVPAWRTLGSEKDIYPDPGSDECLTLQRKWLHDCLTKHEECHLKSQTQVPRRMVSIGLDNMSLRVIETQGTESPYAALSHCWGAKQPLITTTSTLHLRKTNLNWDSMPATFQDAVKVTRGLGLRYLWIDSLCIIQDDAADWESESTKMGAIYQGAQIVIAASASADPDASFLALRQTPYAKPLELQYERQDGGYSIVKARPLLEEFPSIEPLDTRAWTFQEQWLSRRLLRYCSGELRWRCRKKSRCECQTFHLTPGHRYQSFQSCPSPESTTWHYLINWYAMVRVYSRRKLTRRSDKLPAISGMAAIVSEKISSPYIAGLWKDTLLFDLQWGTFPLLSKDKHQVLRATRTYLAPTFSWVSIDSQTEYEHGGGKFKPIDIDVVADATFVDVQITLKGINAFGEVTDGFLILEGPLVSATLSEWEPRSVGDGEGLWYELEHGPKTEIMQADLPLTEGVCMNSLGRLEPTAKRASHEDMILHIEKSPVWCLSIFHRLDGSRFVLILGLSARVPGAYERLGICSFSSTSSFRGSESLSRSWFDDACRTTVKIV